MKIELHLENRYFPWNKYENNSIKCWIKGNLFYDNKLLNASEILSLFSPIISLPHINHDLVKDLLNDFNGAFALVIETPHGILCSVDYNRNIPLFYVKSDTRFIISDDANYIRDQINPRFNEKNGAEFLIAGYITGSETLFDGIFQLQAGEFLTYTSDESQITLFFYHRFWHENYFVDPEEVLLTQLDEIFVRVFRRLIDLINSQGLQIVVPLSGGLDSRIIVAMLKRLGVDNVICFSYGRKDNPEAKISKQVAEALNYPWYFVEYTKTRWYDCYHSEEMREFEKYAGNLSSLPHIQDFLAVKILKEEGKIPDNSIFLPGHAPVLTIPEPSQISQGTPEFEHFIRFYFWYHFSLCRWQEMKSGKKLDIFLREKIRKSLGAIEINDIDSLVNAIELYNFQERQAKFIHNSVRSYEFLGYAWMIPLWDRELINFFKRLDIKFRIKKGLYHRYILFYFTDRYMPVLQGIPNNSEVKQNPPAVKKFMTQMIVGSPILKPIARRIVLPYKLIKMYYFDLLNYYYIMSIFEFMKFYTGIEYINTYLAQKYIENTVPLQNPVRILRDF